MGVYHLGTGSNLGYVQFSTYGQGVDHLRLMLLLFRNQPIHLHCQSIDWFLCELNIGLIWVKKAVSYSIQIVFFGKIQYLLRLYG